jgi:hypothetical protein
MNPGSKGAATGIAKRCNAQSVNNEINIDKSGKVAANKDAKAPAATATTDTGAETAGAKSNAPAAKVKTNIKETAASAAKDKVKAAAAPAAP